ncbi:hypothetical protein PCURB6_37690 [Paenibacillus curdlanolyticus]|nr:hypothetical protein PCURB6_37690 [Paenibacillus curdlanolyticus]
MLSRAGFHIYMKLDRHDRHGVKLLATLQLAIASEIQWYQLLILDEWGYIPFNKEGPQL